MTIQEIQPLLRPSQARERFNLPRDRLYKAINTGELPAVDVGSPARPSFLLRVSDIEAWLEGLTVGGKK